MPNTTAKGFFWVSVEKIGVLGIQFIGIMVLARLVGPDEFGLIGVLSIFIAVANMLVDSGMGGSLVKESSVTNDDYDTLFIYNGAISIASYAILFFFAPIISVFYDEPRLVLLLRVLGISIIFTALSITQYVKLLRDLKFREMAIIFIASALLSTGLAVGLALAETGVWALVAQTVSHSLFTSVGMFMLVRYVPKMNFDKVSFRKQFFYGINILGANLINTIKNNISNSVVGKLFSIEATGYYAQAGKLEGVETNIIVSIIDKAIFPIVSKEATLKNRISRTFELASYTYLLAFPLWTYSFVMAESLILTILGDKWAESVWMFALLCIAGPFYTIAANLRNVFRTTGDTQVILRVNTISAIVSIALIIGLGFLSLRCLIYGVIVSAALPTILFMWNVQKLYDYPIWRQIAVIASSLLPSCVAGGLLSLLVKLIPMMENGVLGLGLSFVIMAVLSFLLFLVFKNKEFLEIVSRLKK